MFGIGNLKVKATISGVGLATIIESPSSVRMSRSLASTANTLSVTLANPNRELSRPLAKVGKKKRKIKLKVNSKIKFVGLIDTVEFSEDEAGSTVTCNARDMIGKLQDTKVPKGVRGKCNFLPASGIVALLAVKAGLLVSADATTRLWKSSGLWDEGASIWEAIEFLAEREGFLCWVDLQMGIPTIKFQKRKIALVPKRIFHPQGGKLGKGYNEFRFIFDRTEAVGKVIVKSWDGDSGRLIKAEAEPVNPPEDAQEIVITDGSLKNKAEAKARAEAFLKRRMLGQQEGSLTIFYTDEIDPGDMIVLAGFKSPINGRYFVSQVDDSLNEQSATTTLHFAPQFPGSLEIKTRAS